MVLPGHELLNLCRSSERELILVAPFVKRGVVERVLEVTSDKIALTLVTRWRPEEIAAGVSDLEVFELLEQSDTSKLRLHQQIHGKYYRSDDNALIGSANLTKSALGWASPSNLELLTPSDPNAEALRSFERQVLGSSVLATREIRDAIEIVAKDLAGKRAYSSYIEEHGQSGESELAWVPLCNRPDRLYQIYTRTDTDSLVRWTVEAGNKDLSALQVPPGLTRETFRYCVAAALMQMPIVLQVDKEAHRPIPDQRGASIVEDNVYTERLMMSSEEHWANLKSWLRYFMPDRYRIRSGTGELVKGQVIGETRLSG